MARVYDLNVGYDDDLLWDDGPSVAIAPPSKTSMTGLSTSKSSPVNSPITLPFSDASPRTNEINVLAPKASPKQKDTTTPWHKVAPHQLDVRGPLVNATPKSSPTRLPWARVYAKENMTTFVLQDAGTRKSSRTTLPWSQVYPKSLDTVLRWASGQPKANITESPIADGLARASYTRIRWARGAKFQTGYIIPFDGEPEDTPEGEIPTILIPLRRTYIVLNSVSLVLRNGPDSGTAVKIKSCTVEGSDSSWAWSFSADIPLSEVDKCKPNVDGLAEVELLVNGEAFYFVIEEYDKIEQFNQGKATIRGRSLTAYLDSPFSPLGSLVQDADTGIVDLALAELLRSPLDLATNFSLNWMLPSWTVLANSWAYKNKSPMQALLDLVQSVDGYLNSDPLARGNTTASPATPALWLVGTTYARGQTVESVGGFYFKSMVNGNLGFNPDTDTSDPPNWLRIPQPAALYAKPRYKTAPWLLAGVNPDISIPRSLVNIHGAKYKNQQEFNLVRVAGQQTWPYVLPVRVTGSGGTLEAPSVSNPLITDAAAAAELGLSVLGKTGYQALVQVDVPLGASDYVTESYGPTYSIGNLGLILPGHLVEIRAGHDVFSAWRGINRDVKIIVNTEGNGAVTVVQSLSIERHL